MPLRPAVPTFALTFLLALGAWPAAAQGADAPENPAEGRAPAPANEAPADEAPANETPADEAPADEAPADEAPANEAPATGPIASRPTRELRHDLRLDLPIAIVGGGTWVVTEAFKGGLAPATCRWCDRNADGSDALNGFDAAIRTALRWENQKLAATSSDVTAYVLAPLAAGGLTALGALDAGVARNIPVDLVIIAEAAAVAAVLNQGVKFLVGRERPFVHVLPDYEKPLTEKPADNNLSFYSGHTSLAFSLAVAGGTVASMRGYRIAPWVWGTGLTVAAGVGWLRIAADKHYATDVLVGMLAGSAVGAALPLLFHGPVADQARDEAVVLRWSVTPAPGGAFASLGGAF